MNRLEAFFERHARRKYILGGLLLILCFNFLLGAIPSYFGLSDVFDATSIPDLWYYYRAGDVRNAMEQWTPLARTVYMFNALVVDNLYALTYGLTYALIGWWIYKGIWPEKKAWKYVAILLPAFVTVTDWVENFALARQVDVYPGFSVGAAMASWSTWLKWNAAVLLTLFLLTGLMGRFLLWLKGRR